MKKKLDEIINNTINLNSINNLHQSDDSCSICMENIGTTNITITKCGHKFCHTFR